MNKFTFKAYLLKNLNTSEDIIESLLEVCLVKHIKKGEYLLRQNEHCKHSFYVENGLLRQFSIDEKGKEHVLSFAPENWFITDRDSSYFNRPSQYYIQALENSRVVVITESFMQQLTKKIPDFTEFNNTLLHKHISHLQSRINLLLSASAEKRYLHFIKLYPDILMRVPQTLIASYLGITPESLSRVRKELATKHFKI